MPEPEYHDGTARPHRAALRACAAAAALAVLLAIVPAGCGDESPEPAQGPSILWIVWDTVRADRLSLYGHARETTPFLEEWARGARVYEDCVSAASTTVPTHASWFTGLQPSEHACDNSKSFLHEGFTTLAERLRAEGYRTYLFSANPHISRGTNFTQGFESAGYPWDEDRVPLALKALQDKIAPLRDKGKFSGGRRAAALTRYDIKDSGVLARDAVLEWLDRDGGAEESERPFFVFINYMEAHMPYLPGRAARERLMTPAQIERSYAAPLALRDFWAFNFGQAELTDAELENIGLIYDSCLIELDDLLRDLLAAFEERGLLDDTAVIITSDHGEHLGEKHLLEHQYSVYEPLARVPLIVQYPGLFEPGRDPRPVINADLYATILELAGIEAPDADPAVYPGLLHQPGKRIRIAECPAYPIHPFKAVTRRHPGFDPIPWSRSLRAVYEGPWKFIWASDGRHELYDLRTQPPESLDLLAVEEDTADRMRELHDVWFRDVQPYDPGDQAGWAATEEERRRLEAIGY